MKKKELESNKAVTYKIRFIYKLRFMLSSLSSLFDNLPEGLHKNKSKGCKSCPENIKA